MLQIFIDGNEANTDKRVGSNAYAWGMIKAMEKITKQEKNISVTVVLSSSPVDDLPKRRARWHYQVLKPGFLFSQWALPLFLKKATSAPAILYSPGHYAPRFCPLPYISSVMDLGYLQFPDHFTLRDRVQLNTWTAHSVKSATKVVCISHFTKSEVMKTYHVPDHKIILAPPGMATHQLLPAHQRDKIKRQLKLNFPYFLFLGTLQPRKNLVRLVDGYEKLIDRLQQDRKIKPERIPRLLVVGKTGWLAKDSLSAINKSSAKLYIKRYGFVTDDQKQVLIHYANALVLPGYYEGFGIPVLEAFNHKTLVIGANSGSLPEVIGPAGLLFNPFSPKEISQALYSAYHMTEAENLRLVKLGQLQLKKFTYDHSAQIVLSAIKELFKKDV